MNQSLLYIKQETNAIRDTVPITSNSNGVTSNEQLVTKVSFGDHNGGFIHKPKCTDACFDELKKEITPRAQAQMKDFDSLNTSQQTKAYLDEERDSKQVILRHRPRRPWRPMQKENTNSKESTYARPRQLERHSSS